MKLLAQILVGLLYFGCFATTDMSEMKISETFISVEEFERIWRKKEYVSGVVEKYIQGSGDSLTYEYAGHLNLCSDDIAEIIVTSISQKQPRRLRVSVSRDGPNELSLFKKVGTKINFSIPLLYMKYDPWGFVPSDDLKEIVESKDRAKEGGSKVKSQHRR
ncbi:MAG: hypothetical protein QM760_15805 [Nibricoccus sp.]